MSLREHIHPADTLSWLTIIFRVRNNSVDSLLLSLPAEIRVKIWDYAIGGMRIYFQDGHRVEYSIDGATETNKFELDRQIALPRVCRQIYSETGANFYRFNVFSFEDYPSLDRFRLRMKRAQWEALRTIAVSVPLVMKIHPPSPPGRRMLAEGYKGCAHPRRRDGFTLYGPWRSFSRMFHELHTVIVYGDVAQAESTKALEVVKRTEGTKVFVFE